MKGLGSILLLLQRQWLLGFSIVLVAGLALVMFGLVAAGLVSGAVWLAGAPDSWRGWLAASAIIWGPLAVGLVARSIKGLVEASRLPEAPRPSPYA